MTKDDPIAPEFRAWCESKSIAVRHELGLLGFDPLPARCLAERLGVTLVEPGELLDLDVQSQLVVTQSLRWSAVALRGSPPMIIYHPRRTVIEIESNVMHELAHLMLDHTPELLVKITDRLIARCYPKRQEWEADYFGSCLQLPLVALQHTRQRGISDDQLSEQYKVSSQMIQARKAYLGRTY